MLNEDERLLVMVKWGTLSQEKYKLYDCLLKRPG